MLVLCGVCCVARFSSMVVRAKAVEWLSKLNDDDICDFLTQLVLVSTFMYTCSETHWIAGLLYKDTLRVCLNSHNPVLLL